MKIAVDEVKAGMMMAPPEITRKPVAMQHRIKSGQRTRQEYAGNGIDYCKIRKILAVMGILDPRGRMSVVLIYPFDGDPACTIATVFQEMLDQRLHRGEVRPVKDGSAFSPGCDETRVGQFL